ncbi:MAG: HD domain-containing protein [Planctomycetota bacterium]|jgi:uncharacterized protein
MNRDQIEEVARDRMLERKEQEAREPGWLFYHGIRTAKIAEKLCDLLEMEVNRDTVFAGALFHDIGKGRDRHSLVGAKVTKTLLERHCTSEELEAVCEIVRLHNQRHGQERCPEVVRVVQDADLLDHVGPIVPWLAFYWSGTHREAIDSHVRYVTGEENQRYRKGMRERLNFEVSVTMFDERVAWENDFFETFRRVYFEGVWQGDLGHVNGPCAGLRGDR